MNQKEIESGIKPVRIKGNKDCLTVLLNLSSISNMGYEQFYQKIVDKKLHAYFWCNNKDLKRCFDKIIEYKLKYIQCITMPLRQEKGKYYQNTTYHLICTTKGSLSLLQEDIVTWMEGKPDTFKKGTIPDEVYTLIGKCSPEPLYDLSSKKTREGWSPLEEKPPAA